MMMKINRLLINVCARDLQQSKRFYTSLFTMEVNFESDWFIHLTAENGSIELGIILEGHEVVPEQVQMGANSSYLTFVVDDADELFAKAVELGFDTLESPKDTDYGQRRALLAAPEGTICDISSLIKG